MDRRVPNRRTARLVSLKMKPRKSLVNSWEPAGVDEGMVKESDPLGELDQTKTWP